MPRLREDVRSALPKLKTGRYKTLYVDPPWEWMYGGHAARDFNSARTGRSNKSFVGGTPYGRLSVAELVALAPEIRRVAAPARTCTCGR